MSRIGISIEPYIERLEIGGRKVDIGGRRKGSPTQAFAQDLMSMLATASPSIKIDKLVLVDTGGQERDSCTEDSGLSKSGPTNNRAIVQCNVQATASYSFNMVRLYSGTKKYFETQLPATYTVSQGQQVGVSISIDIRVTMDETLSDTGILQKAQNRSAQNFINILIRALLYGDQFRFSTFIIEASYFIYISLGCSSTGTSVTCTGSATPGFDCGDPQTPCPVNIKIYGTDPSGNSVIFDLFVHNSLQIVYFMSSDIIYARLDVSITSQLVP